MGFQKSLRELPRSASTVSWEQIERFNIKDIDELVALAPGSFTQSFFGVAGSLDVRGTPGETYFRGIRRLDNPGNSPPRSVRRTVSMSCAGLLHRSTGLRKSAAT